ncbi:MAG: 3-phenylpropionate/trans-cinnamate dioxygenase ferredoxin component [Kribbellaceae bacterium]|jgi:3-phenylpropionate/trans-cinnamate dioxygenase ferredoxin subunit|nr:3-phenylpropionate/trans-cinnamate dioxygenase ferredoxin component [Kribbellaceae bacterium]
MSDSFERACALSDVPDEGVIPVEVGGMEVAIVRSCGQVFAVRDECSHAQIQLSEGEVEDCEIECWLHGSRFDLRTGEPTSLPAYEPVPVYPVRIDGDDVLVDVKNPLNSAS